MINLLSEYNFSGDIVETCKYLLPISATLLGLIYVASIYWLQSGFQELEFSKSILEDVLMTNAKVLFDLLISNSLICLFVFAQIDSMISFTFWIFQIIIIKDLLDNIADRGYIVTLNSNKFIPSKCGKFRSYLRKIKNSGLGGFFRFSFFLLPLTIYPLYLSYRDGKLPFIGENSISIFIFATTAIGLLQIKPLLVEAFDVKKNLDKTMMNENDKSEIALEDSKVKWSDKKRDVENKILRERLKYLDVSILHEEALDMENWTSYDLKTLTIMYNVSVNDNGKVHINLITPAFDNDKDLRAFIFEWTKKILLVFAESKSDVSYYSLSYFRKFKDESNQHLAMFKASRSEIVKNKSFPANDFVKKLEGKYMQLFLTEIKN